MQRYKLFGIAGRESAGKSTTANFMAQSSGKITYDYVNSISVIQHLVDLWFTFDDNDRDVIWHISRFELQARIVALFNHYLTGWQRNEYTLIKNLRRDSSPGWRIFGLADLLKVGCSSLFGISIMTLMGEDEDNRKLREVIKTEKFSSPEIQKTFPNSDGSMTGRQCLQYVATQIFKANFDDDFWNKIIYAKIDQEIKNGNRIVIPDARFHSDLHNIWRFGPNLGVVVLLYRTPADLLLSDEDRKTHPSCWEFLQIIADNKDKPTIYIQNSDTKEDLQAKIFGLLFKTSRD